MHKHLIIALSAALCCSGTVAAGTHRQDAMPNGSMSSDHNAMEQQGGMHSGATQMQQRNTMDENSRAGISGMLSFGAMDKDGDGSISHEEFERALRARWQQADKNQDGKISQSEFSALEQAGGMNVDQRKPDASESKMGGSSGNPPN